MEIRKKEVEVVVLGNSQGLAEKLHKNNKVKQYGSYQMKILCLSKKITKYKCSKTAMFNWLKGYQYLPYQLKKLDIFLNLAKWKV